MFRVHIGHTADSPDLAEYVQKLNRVQKGIFQLFESLGLTSQLILHRLIDERGHEWIDINMETERQLDFIDVFESSLGSPITKLKLDHQRALNHAKNSAQLLRELQVRRSWPAADLMDLLERRQEFTPITKFMSELDSGDGTIRLLFPDGQASEAELPTRRFSALWDQTVDLIFRPRMAGPDGALVYLTKSDAARIGAKTREIFAAWADPLVDDFSVRLQDSANTHSWVSGSCLVVTNGTGVPKGLLLKTLAYAAED